ncbi:hypothetical protein ACXC9Q_19865 [Kribbella sp. CWNU-51]
MTQLPAFVSRPMVDAYADALGADAVAPTPTPAGTVVDSPLTDGVPARLALDASRTLVLAVPVGVARVLLDADPLTVVWDDRTVGTSTDRTPVDMPRPRLTLLVDERIADSAVLVEHRAIRFADSGQAQVEVVVDRLVLTAAALRSAGRSSSRIVLRWRDLLVAGDVGPASTAGDPALDLVRRSAP